ncbi:MAG: SDR family oxidoreductase [Burkholderiales bacterium]
MPAIPRPHGPRAIGARPAAFRRTRLLIVGCGDVGCRVLRRLPASVRVLALTSSTERLQSLRAAGAVPLLGDLDAPHTLRRLAGWATRVLHLAPPPTSTASDDPRTRNLLRALRRSELPTALVYGSTSGVYGDCAGAAVSETRTANPATPRARRRVDAERSVRALGCATRMRVTILRIPGIYAQDRPNGTPRERLLKRTPALAPDIDVYTNHIHADDLARACTLALWRGAPQRTVNVSDCSDLRMGEYFDLAADLYGLPRAPRINADAAMQQLSPMQRSFMSESRRLSNQRMKCELRLVLRYPTVLDGLR